MKPKLKLFELELMEKNDIKQIDKSVKLLSYRAAYERLVIYIHSYYWQLEAKQPGAGGSSSLVLYQAKSNGAVGAGSGSGPSGRKRLNAFLQKAHSLFPSAEPSALPLLRQIMTAIHGEGHHFPGQLAKAVTQGKFFPLPEEDTANIVVASGTAAQQAEEVLESLKKTASSIYARYSAPADQDALSPRQVWESGIIM